MVLGWCGVQAALNAMLAAVTAMIPDQVPADRRGRIGGIVAVAQTIGVVGRDRHRGGDRQHRGRLPRPSRRSCSCSRCRSRLYSRDLALPVRGAARVRPAPRSCASFWISPRAHPDFGWAWLTRFLVNLGNALGLLYLLYFLQDVVGFSSDEAENRVFVLTAVYALTLVLTTVVFGAWSDRIGRRKVFVIWSGLVSGVRGGAARRRAELAGGAGRGGGDGLRVRHLHRRRLRADHRGAPDRGRPGQGPRRHQHRQRAARRCSRRCWPACSCGVVEVARRRGRVERRTASRSATSRSTCWRFLASVLGSVFVTRIRGVR